MAPVLSLTEHEANNSLVWISDKLWQSLNAEQKQWVQTAGAEVNKNEPAKAFELEHQSIDKLKAIGVKIVPDVDKSGFVNIATPYLDKLSAGLGPARRQDRKADRQHQLVVPPARRGLPASPCRVHPGAGPCGSPTSSY